MATQEDIDRLVSTIQILKNRTLMAICANNSLAKSGNKADLQKRIANLIDSAAQDPNPQKFINVKSSILSIAQSNSLNNYHTHYLASSPLPPSPSVKSHQGMTSPFDNRSTSGTSSNLQNGPVYGGEPNRNHGLQFKSSPFYEIGSRLGEIRQCDVMVQHRNSIPISIRATTYPDLQRCLTDPSLRVMVFCAAASVGVQDIAFPHQCELKVNGGDVKANLRGLKNKPGSTRPVDITDLLRFKPSNYSNTLEFTYALTSKRYFLAIYLCQTHSATTLASRIERRSRITKASVIREVTRQAQDPDIVATSQVLSLKCPLTYMRLSLPIRATTCKHVQCFDATSYLQLQEQGPQWLCPVCSNPAPFESLAVDDYVRDILANTSSDQDQVTIDPDGTWHANKLQNEGLVSTPKLAETSFVDDDDDFASLTMPSGTLENIVSIVSSTGTTTTPSHASRKRPREVIDLTLSDDDDDEPSAPPFKRQNTSANEFEPLLFPSI